MIRIFTIIVIITCLSFNVNSQISSHALGLRLGGDGSINGAGIGGQIGLDYNFLSSDVPLQLSLDARPMWDLIGSHSGIGWGVSLGIRYLFLIGHSI